MSVLLCRSHLINLPVLSNKQHVFITIFLYEKQLQTLHCLNSKC